MGDKNAKIVLRDGRVLMDLTTDTVTEDKLLKGYTAHDAAGEPITGTCEFDANTQDATANENEILVNKSAYVRGKKVPGKMPNNGAVSGKINAKDGTYTVPQGYHDGSGTVQIDEAERAKLIPSNIRAGVKILEVEGDMTGTEDVKAQNREVTPSFADQTVLPDADHNYLASVVVKAIPVTITDNSAGGKTVTIG